MRVLMISSHYLGVLYLEELLKAGDQVVGAIVLPDNGDWYIPPEYDFRAAAFRNYIPVYEPNPSKLNSPEFLEVVENLKPDYIISGFYPRIFSERLIKIPQYGCINTHPSGLPRFRGLSPYFTHFLFGEKYNKITMHWLDPGVDTGDIIAQASVLIEEEDTGFESGHKVIEAASEMFRKNWPLIKQGNACSVKQNEALSSIFNFDKGMSEIIWNKPALSICNLVRTLTKPLFGSWSSVDGNKIMIWSANPITIRKVDSELEPGTIVKNDDTGFVIKCGDGFVKVTSYSFIDNNKKVDMSRFLNKIMTSGKVDYKEIKNC